MQFQRKVLLKRLIYKLTSAPVWKLERNRKYPIRDSVTQLLPTLEDPGTPQEAPILAVLCMPSQFSDALWSAWSWYRFLQGQVKLWICCDGEILKKDREIAATLLPNARIISLADLWEELDLSVRGIEKIESHPLSRKLKLILGLQSKYDLLYSDCDVLAFNEPHKLKQIMELNNVCAYMVETHDVSPSQLLQSRSLKLGYSFDRLLNSGLLYLSKNSLNPTIVTDFLEDWQPPLEEWTLEQWLLANMISRSKSYPLDSSRYVISGQRQFWHQIDVEYENIVCRHFTNPVRHVMYCKGMPAILKSLR